MPGTLRGKSRLAHRKGEDRAEAELRPSSPQTTKTRQVVARCGRSLPFLPDDASTSVELIRGHPTSYDKEYSSAVGRTPDTERAFSGSIQGILGVNRAPTGDDVPCSRHLAGAGGTDHASAPRFTALLRFSCLVAGDLWHTVWGVRGVAPGPPPAADRTASTRDLGPRTGASRSRGGRSHRAGAGLALASPL
jgi:hypothetical protein